MTVPFESAAEVLALCARHCCICRRFRPTQLQVHHILERNEGGDDSIGNLIAICVSCHSDVHSNTKLTRRFTRSELLLHRSAVYQLVVEAKLPAAEPAALDLSALSAAVIKSLQERSAEDADEAFPLSIRSLDILLTAVAHQKPIRIARDEHGVSIHAGPGHYLVSGRRGARVGVPDPLIRLISLKLIDGVDDLYHPTDAGAAFADDVLSANPSFTTVKAKCLSCGLHFVICTWAPERHDHSTLHCPECGQSQGAFLVWKQRMFGFIFQTVPGAGQAVAGTTHALKRRKSDA
jgi:hypothetical protein